MSMKVMYDLKDMLCAELDEIGKKGEMSAGDLETVHKLTDTIKNIDKITMLEESGYSRDEDYSRNSYDDGNSYRKHYVRGHYSRDDARDSMMRKLEDMIRNVDGYDRETIQHCIDELKNT